MESYLEFYASWLCTCALESKNSIAHDAHLKVSRLRIVLKGSIRIEDKRVTASHVDVSIHQNQKERLIAAETHTIRSSIAISRS